MAKSKFIVLCFFYPFLAWSGEIVVTGEVLDPYYAQCVGQILNHPLKGQFFGPSGVNQINSSLYDDADELCSCREVVEKNEGKRFAKESFSYFFKGREDYFTSIDTCLLNNVSEKNFTFFNALYTYDFLTPYVESRFRELQVQGTTFVAGRAPASAEMSCVTLKVLEKCQKIKSLYFTYRCVKKRMGDLSFIQSLKVACHREIWEVDYGERI